MTLNTGLGKDEQSILGKCHVNTEKPMKRIKRLNMSELPLLRETGSPDRSIVYLPMHNKPKVGTMGCVSRLYVAGSVATVYTSGMAEKL